MTRVCCCDGCYDIDTKICKTCLWCLRTMKEIVAIFKLRKDLGIAPDDHMGSLNKRKYKEYLKKEV